MATSRRTRGRRAPFKCGHRGYGTGCHRCDQANELETRANELAQVVKTQAKALPDYVTATNDAVRVRAGGVKVEALLTGKLSRDGALAQIVETMRSHATRLQKTGMV